jgi:hypothetical protein
MIMCIKFNFGLQCTGEHSNSVLKESEIQVILLEFLNETTYIQSTESNQTLWLSGYHSHK